MLSTPPIILWVSIWPQRTTCEEVIYRCCTARMAFYDTFTAQADADSNQQPEWEFQSQARYTQRHTARYLQLVGLPTFQAWYFQVYFGCRPLGGCRLYVLQIILFTKIYTQNFVYYNSIVIKSSSIVQVWWEIINSHKKFNVHNIGSITWYY
jgi:hypothetical protein